MPNLKSLIWKDSHNIEDIIVFLRSHFPLYALFFRFRFSHCFFQNESPAKVSKTPAKKSKATPGEKRGSVVATEPEPKEEEVEAPKVETKRGRKPKAPTPDYKSSLQDAPLISLIVPPRNKSINPPPPAKPLKPLKTPKKRSAAESPAPAAESPITPASSKRSRPVHNFNEDYGILDMIDEIEDDGPPLKKQKSDKQTPRGKKSPRPATQAPPPSTKKDKPAPTPKKTPGRKGRKPVSPEVVEPEPAVESISTKKGGRKSSIIDHAHAQEVLQTPPKTQQSGKKGRGRPSAPIPEETISPEVPQPVKASAKKGKGSKTQDPAPEPEQEPPKTGRKGKKGRPTKEIVEQEPSPPEPAIPEPIKGRKSGKKVEPATEESTPKAGRKAGKRSVAPTPDPEPAAKKGRPAKPEENSLDTSVKKGKKAPAKVVGKPKLRKR